MIWTKEALIEMPEHDLCQEVLIPLFEALGYNDVHYHHGGALEQGKDIVMWRAHDLRGRVNYAVVAKAVKITGGVSSVGEVCTQVEQAFGAPFLDPGSLEERKVHHCFVVSSREIITSGTNSLSSVLASKGLKDRVTIIDGDRLWNLVQEHLPQKIVLSSLQSACGALNEMNPDFGCHRRSESAVFRR